MSFSGECETHIWKGLDKFPERISVIDASQPLA